MNFELVAIPLVDLGALPLFLPEASASNSGGFLLPGGTYGYSNIDLLIAGLEISFKSLVRVWSKPLNEFFDTYRGNKVSEHHVFVSFKIDNIYFATMSIAMVKSQIYSLNIESNLKSLMNRNAPLTFKWEN